LLANQQETGYYLSRYDEPTFEKLVANLRALSPLERRHTISQMRFLLTNGLEQPLISPHLSALLASQPSTISELLPLVSVAATVFGWSAASGTPSSERNDQFRAIEAIAPS
jgi:hypothetical protein